MRLRFLFPALLCVAILSGCKRGGDADVVPEVTLKTYTGESVTFGSKDGKVSLVVFWATWCIPCIEEIPQLKNFETTYGKQGFRVLAINIDDPEGHEAVTLMQQFEVNYTVLVEEDGRAEKAFGGLRALPTSFLVGRDGKVKKKLEGLYPAPVVEQLITAQL